MGDRWLVGGSVEFLLENGVMDSALFGGDSACGLESRISSPRCVDRHPSLISLRGLKNHDSSTTILESQSGFTKQAEIKTTALESTFDKNAQNIQTLQKVDSSKQAKNVSKQPKDSRISKETCAAHARTASLVF